MYVIYQNPNERQGRRIRTTDTMDRSTRDKTETPVNSNDHIHERNDND